MKNFYRAILFCCITLCSALSNVSAATTYDWTGALSTDWGTPGNWKIGGTAAATSPGNLSTDIVQIGVTYAFTNQPILSGSVSVATITVGTQTVVPTITINAVLTVSGNITMQNNSVAGGMNISWTGSGSVSCTNFNLGDATKPPSPTAGLGLANATYNTQLNFSSLNLTVSNNITLTTTSQTAILSIIFPSGNVNNPIFNFNSGTITVANQIKTVDANDINIAAFMIVVINYVDVSSSAQFLMHPTTGYTALLNLNGANALNLDGSAGYVDFDCTCGGISTVNYGGSVAQEVYTTSFPYTASRHAAVSVGLDRSPSVYQAVTFSGTSAKTADGGSLTVDNGLTLTASSTETLDLSVNNPTVTIGGNMTTNTGTTLLQGSGSITVGGNTTNAGTLTLGSGALNIAGNYSNTGTFTAGTGLVTFNGASAETLADAGGGTIFNNVTFNSGGAKTITSGNFSVSGAGVLTMGSNTALATGGNLTLISDVNSSATVAALAAGASITGNVNVQRFIQGSAASITKRGYRLISSAVYTGTVSGPTNVYDVKYLLNSVFISGAGGTANGFNITTPSNNPSLYLFREDDPPPPSISTLFTTGYNWKGVAKMNNSNAYDIGIQKKLTVSNVADTTANIPVGNGILFYFRGDDIHNTVNKTTSPFAFPEDVTTTQVGALNTGTVNVKLWFANAANALGNNLSYTAANATNPTTNTLKGGFTLVGNPYASTINWEKYNRNGANSSIYGGGSLASTIWVFNEANKQYDSYIPKGSVSSAADTTTTVNPGTATGSASNMIASGQGFFVRANVAGAQTLSFRETAKVTTQPTAALLHNLMGIPKSFAAQGEPLLRLKLITDSVNWDEIVIRFDNTASTKFSPQEDAEDMGGSGALESLSVFSSDGVPLAIDFTPFPTDQPAIIPLLANATASGTYQLVSTQLDNVPSVYSIWLKDAFKNDSLLMTAKGSYTFQIDKNNPATFGANRFSLIVGKDTSQTYHLVDFTAKKTVGNTQAQLVWKTVNEQNYFNFTVERSIDSAKTFAVVGGMQATGAGTYSLLDKAPVKGQNLYRLKQEDLNNTIRYSAQLTLIFSDQAANKIKVYPNPATHVINLNIGANAAENATYQIIVSNSSGVVVKQATSAQSSWQSSIAGLQPGTYVIKVLNSTDNSYVGDAKFVKL